MFRKLALGLVACAVVAGCKGKQTQSDQSIETLPAGGQSTAIDSSPLSYDPMGSDSGKIAGLETVHFGYDKSSLDAASKKVIASNVEWMKSNPGVKVQIEGHCDNRGTIEYNVALGERRANAVKAYMVSLGIAGDRLSVISYGKEKPLDMGDTEAAWAKNRRANFVPAQ
ncbi:peptidoglycan-associated lipoprotein Pal [Bdellovibrio bacteriovorus]|uniref:Peptidoglycan-associated lipoprotein n=1 Tax=Bdellovibrio bacteriovorus TaxID=959 RepID=A0A150WIA2_BDEBC|nr:peptidoglycan-associated lipoprotein Pal [Bdellovibrio bacteriovorus]KYG63344.1 peptidoglycan-associated lipoprotein [Bdellovibrio bacteriovorus]KYG69460.1 peptidoglycan-associated lipoprotein [Bdellovibrio bacteriovorus]